jgi:hypothetical protein
MQSNGLIQDIYQLIDIAVLVELWEKRIDVQIFGFFGLQVQVE